MDVQLKLSSTVTFRLNLVSRCSTSLSEPTSTSLRCVGAFVGTLVGKLLGVCVGESVPDSVGIAVGGKLGENEGAGVGTAEGMPVKCILDWRAGQTHQLDRHAS